MKRGRLTLAVDGGGTKTHCVVGTAEGDFVAEAKAGPSLYQLVGMEQAVRTIRAAAVEALALAGGTLEDVAFAYLGLSGADFESDFKLLREALAPALAPAPFEVANDAWIALLGGCPDGWGAAVICGTGTNAVAKSSGGKTATLRSKGYEFGNYGGGPHVAVEALNRAFRSEERTGPRTRLEEVLPGLLGTAGMEELFVLLHDGDGPEKSHLDRITPAVFRLANEGDAVCQDLLVDMGTEVGAMACGVIMRAGMQDEDFPVALAGSLFAKAESPLFQDAALLRIHRTAPRARPVRSEGPPVFGALKEAARRARS